MKGWGLLAEIAAICVLGTLMFATNSRASAQVTDPRKCEATTNRVACAQAAAKLVTRHVLAKRVGLSYLWQGPLVCTSQRTLLRWRCQFADQFPQLPPKGYVAVTYRATHTGWHVYTSIVATP